MTEAENAVAKDEDGSRRSQESSELLEPDSEILSSGVIPGEIERQVKRHREAHWENLEPSLRAFAIAYVQCLSPVEAAHIMGKLPQFGRTALRNPLVLALISDLQAEGYAYNIITEQFVRRKLVDVLPKLAGEEKVAIVLSDGTAIEAKKFFASEHTAVLRALGESLKREHGTTLHIDGNVGHTHGLDPDTIRELQALRAGVERERETRPETIDGEVLGENGPVLPIKVLTPPPGCAPPLAALTVPGSPSESE